MYLLAENTLAEKVPDGLLAIIMAQPIQLQVDTESRTSNVLRSFILLWKTLSLLIKWLHHAVINCKVVTERLDRSHTGN